MFPVKTPAMRDTYGDPPNIKTPETGNKRKHLDQDDNDHDLQQEILSKRPKTNNSSSKNTYKAEGKKVSNGDPNLVVEKEEKRLRRFRPKAPQSYLEIKDRALTQRLTVQDRERCGTDETPEEKVMIAGSTGNLYTVHIGRQPSCNCPHACKGNQCKHIVYVMLRLLKAPENIAYQLALTSSELRDLFKNAPPIPKADGEADSSDGNRKPIEGDCPICYTEFEAGEEIVYCKAACGNNIHKDCMNSWMRVRKAKATCPMCRSIWIGDFLAGKKVNLEGTVTNEEGYVNIASQLGLSGERDYSSYHQPWARRRYGGYGGDW